MTTASPDIRSAPERKPKLAFWFRYGPADHAELFHALPPIIEQLVLYGEIHYFCMRSAKAVPPEIRSHIILHLLPFHANRKSNRDKVIKSLFWLMCLPWIGLRCRWMGIDAVYIDETLPLAALAARIFFGKRVAFTVADLFVDTYLGHHRWTRLLARMIKSIDFATWRRLPMIFTRAQSAKHYLVNLGFQAERIFAVYDPCDLTFYQPMDKQSARAQWGFQDTDIVLVYHGILYVNKGLDRILNVLAQLHHPALSFLIIGDGPEMAALKTLTHDLGLDSNVRFTGYMEPRDVVVALNASDIGLVARIGMLADHFVITSVLGHCMACGLPVLASRLRGICEIVKEGQTGYLFDPNNMQEFRIKLEKLIQRPDLRQSMGSRALNLARSLFSIEQATRHSVKPLVAFMNDRSS